jgi:hypothetical protein
MGGAEVNILIFFPFFHINILSIFQENRPLLVGSIIPGGAADLDGRLRVGDQIVEIDGQRVEGAPHNLAVDLIKQVSNMLNLIINYPEIFILKIFTFIKNYGILKI